MRIKFQEIKKASVTLVSQFVEAAELASRLRVLMDSEPLYSTIQERHTFGAKSQEIQALLVPDLERLGFQSERRGLFAQYKASGLRPDFYRPLHNSGILVEIERGKVLTNNMDLLDLWKCHVCRTTDFLFLIVPIERRSQNGKPIKGFDGACRRLSTFFEQGNYVNVEAVFLFGY